LKPKHVVAIVIYINVNNFSVLMYICCALIGAVKDSVSQNAWCNSKKKMNAEALLDAGK